MRIVAAWILIVSLTACSGGGGGGSSSTPPAPTIAPSKAFVADAGGAAIGSSSNPNPPPGPLVVDRVISGSNTMLDSNLVDFALDAANDRLYVADLRSILVFDKVSTSTGDVAPTRVVSTIGGGSGNFVGIYLDAVHDRLYASAMITLGTATVEVFDNVSSLSSSAPTRTFTFASNYLFDVAVDTTKDILYAYNLDTSGLSQISVFDGAASLTGNGLTSNRTISIGDSFSSGVPLGMFVDPASDRLYAPRFGEVMVFDNASTKDGSVSTTAAPSRTINLPVSDMSNIFVELTADRLYTADASGVNIIENASSASGTPATITRVLAPSGSAFEAVAVMP